MVMVRDTGNYDGPGLTTAGRNGDLPAKIVERHGVRNGIHSFTVESAKGRHKLRMTGNQKINARAPDPTPPADLQPGSVAEIAANTASLSQYLHDNLKVDTHLHGGKNPSDPLVVSLIVAQRKNRGDGTKAMQAITDYADAHGLTVALTPDGTYGGSVPRLTEFYKRFGFAPNKGRNRDFSTKESMVRSPRSTAERPSTPQPAPVGFTPDTSYRMQHSAPRRTGEDDVDASDVTMAMPDSYEHPEYYTTGSQDPTDRLADKQSAAQTRQTPAPGDVIDGWKVLRVFSDGSISAEHTTATRFNNGRNAPGRLIPVRRTFKPGTLGA